MPGTRIKQRRVQMGLTQDDMSLRLHISQSAYSRIENKQDTLRMDTAREIARILGCTINDLLPDEAQLLNEQTQPPQPGPSKEELLRMIDTVLDEKISHLKVWMQEHFVKSAYI